MKRRDFIGLAAAATATGVIGCSAQDVANEASADAALPEISWEMATSWPLSLDTIFGGAEVFAKIVGELTAGKFKITPRAGGELAKGTEVLDVVESGSVPIGHTASYYYVGKSDAVAFGTALPFGMTARQNNAWFYEGGGLGIMQDFYRASNTDGSGCSWCGGSLFPRIAQSYIDMEGDQRGSPFYFQHHRPRFDDFILLNFLCTDF